MEPISITLSAGGRPFLTTRVNSVVFDQSGRTTRTERTDGPPSVGNAASQQDAVKSQPTGPLPDEWGAGFGAEAQRGAFQANASEAANLGRAPANEQSQADSTDGLTDAERELVDELRARDAEVRRHEQAHAAVGGQYASAPSYTFQLGPDGRRYAIGGEVQIDVAPVAGDPEATIDKMTVVKAAALAPAEPSSADRRVASLADAQRLEAVSELATLKTDERIEMLAENSIQSNTSPQTGADPAKAIPDRRFADAAGMLALGEESLPGQELDTAA